MNMMAVSWEDTTILIDAGVMFPDPDQLGVDLIIPDLTYLEARRDSGQGAGADARPRGSHRRRAARDAALRRPGLRHRHDAGAGRAQARGARHRPRRPPEDASSPRQTVTVGPLTIEFIRVTHSMPDCVALAITSPVGMVLFTGDFKIDQTPIDGQHFDLHRFAELGRAGRAGALRRQHQRRSQGLHRPRDRRHRGLRGDLHQHRRQAGGRDVLVEHLPHAGAGRSGGAVRPPRRLRRPQHGADHRDRAAARLPARAVGRADPRQRRAPTTRRRTCCASRPARRASRRRRCRASPSTTTASSSSAPDDTVVFSARAIPGNEKAIAPHDEPRRPPRRRRHHRRHEARARVRPRLRGGAEADAVAGPAALLRAGPRRVPPAGAARPRRPARHGRRRPHGAGAAGAGRRHHPVRPGRAPASPTRRRPAASSSTSRASARSATRCCATAATSPATASSSPSSAISRATGALVGEPELVARGFVVGRRPTTRCSTTRPARSPSASRPRAWTSAPTRA